MSEKYVFESTEKYLKKLDAGLSGRVFRLAMDDGYDYELRFIDGEIVEWREEGGPLHWETYGCLKSDEGIWFVASVLSGREPYTCVTLVLDEPQSLVTMCVSTLGYYPKRPRLVVVDYRFGAIRVADQPLPAKRHGFTNDLSGKKITWHYANGFINTHIYMTERHYRIRMLTNPKTPEELEQEEREIALGLRPRELLYEEPGRYIRIRKNLYLISFVEDNMNRNDPDRGGNNLMVLANLDRGFDCGRTFSRNQKTGGVEHGMFRAYGEVIVEDIPIEHEPSPYRI